MTDRIRVIIVDDVAETRENVRKLLQFDHEVEVVGMARSGKEGIEIARELKPDVVLMDINMPDMDGITATENIRRLLPFVKIVILSVQNDPNYMRRAMLAGANDFLAKPPTVDELTSALRRAGGLAKEEKAKSAAAAAAIPQVGGTGLSTFAATPGMNGTVVTVYSPKGGSGCTTVATNLAISLQSEDTPVVLVDGDLQFGDVAIFMNEQGKFSAVDLASRLNELEPEFVDSMLIKHAPSGIRVLAAPFRPEYAENVDGEQFGLIIKYLRRMYAYVVIDTPSALTDITLSAIDGSDLVVLLTTQEIPAIKNARLFLDLADALSISRRRILFALNRFDKRIGITPEKISENFKQELVAVIPFDDRVVVPSVNRGVPLMVSNKTHPVARAIYDLSEVVRERIVELSIEEPANNSGKSKVKTKKWLNR